MALLHIVQLDHPCRTWRQRTFSDADASRSASHMAATNPSSRCA